MSQDHVMKIMTSCINGIDCGHCTTTKATQSARPKYVSGTISTSFCIPTGKQDVVHRVDETDLAYHQ